MLFSCIKNKFKNKCIFCFFNQIFLNFMSISMFHFLTMYQDIQQGSGVRPSQQARPQNRPKQNRPSQNTRPQKRPQQTRPQKRPQKTKPQRRPQQNQRPSNNNNRQQQGNNNNRGNNDPRLSVMCPSAMLCVPKPNCDFKGVITDIPLNNLSPEIEALRVPYLVSF